uniref:Leucine-rich repeat-containing protein 74A-like n=2 Tax=Crassostrea virginica TaxID=6565 RepID=A0A8B8AJW1_CRAVI|nr:leucine-rich repeat-containing protein 74A-like [Crassostrea virginica]
MFRSDIASKPNVGLENDKESETGDKCVTCEEDTVTETSRMRGGRKFDDNEDLTKKSDDQYDEFKDDGERFIELQCPLFFEELEKLKKTDDSVPPLGNNLCSDAEDDGLESENDEEKKDVTQDENEMTDDDKESTDSDFYDTDLDDLTIDESKKNTDFGESDFLICRQRYLDACVSCGDVPPQQRILRELERKTLSVAYRCLSARDIKPLCVALVDNLRVENVNLSHCDIQDQGCVHVAQLLTDNVVITRLNLCSNGISHVSMKSLSQSLSCNRILQHLDLSGNKLDDKAAHLLAPGIAKNNSLLSLNLSNNALSENSGLTLGAALAENKHIQEINLSWNQLCRRGAVGVFKALEVNTTLTSIDLSWNGLLYNGSVAVSKCLKSSKTLTSLDISHNNINWNGAYVISKGLAANDTLQVLKIGNNPLTTTGAMDLVMAVSNDNSRVRLLDMIDVAVLAETELMAAMLMSKRKFTLIHGGVVRSPDLLGERKEREVTAMERVMAYMKSVGLRPLELLRAFDKSAMINVSKKEFKNRLKKTGVPLWRYELESLAQTISSRDVDRSGGINYRKLMEEVNRQILSERNRKIAERVKRERRREYHRRILNVALPLEVLSETDEEMVRPPTTLSDKSASVTSHRGTLTRTTSNKSVLSLPRIPNSLNPEKSRTAQPMEIKRIIPTQKPMPSLSMCAPLGCPHNADKKKVKKKKRKSAAAIVRHNEGQSWMSVQITKRHHST